MATHEQSSKPRPTLDTLLARSARPQAPSALGLTSSAATSSASSRTPKTLREIQAASTIPLPRDQPDATILITIETRCTGCGRTYRSPNQRLMHRYGNRTGIATRPTPHTIPHEHTVHRVVAPHCEHCF